MDNSNILEITNLYTKFDTEDGIVHAVNGISYSLARGETLGIVGESGCGKSVSVLSITRLLLRPPSHYPSRSNSIYLKKLTCFNSISNWI